MKKTIQALLLLFFILPLCQGAVGQSRSADPYTYRKGDPNGVGKWYMGREIAYVMGYHAMDWLERPERDQEENTTLLLQNMNIQPGDTIADIGAGSGYHVFKMAPMAAEGLVYAVDIQEEMLRAIGQKKAQTGQNNVIGIKGSNQAVNLPENSVDKVLLVDVYHEFEYPAEMMASIKKALSPGGKLFLIEYRAEDATIPIKRVHRMSRRQAVKEMKAAGLTLYQNIQNLPWQHCLVFVKE